MVTEMPERHRFRMRDPRPRTSLFLLLGVFLLVAGASVGYLLFIVAPSNRAEALADWNARITAMATDRRAAIERWVDDLRSNAETLAGYPTARYLLSGRRGPPFPFDPDLGPERHLQDLFGAFVDSHEYAHAALYDSVGDLVAQSSGTRTDHEHLAPLVQEALAGRSPVNLRAGDASLVALAVPVPDTGGRAMGAVIIETEARRFLFPLLESDPIPSRTLETVLVTDDVDRVAYLNPLRKRPTAAARRVPVDSIGIAAAAAVSDPTVSGRYTDYAGDDVLATARPIDGTPWALMAKVDVAEALSEYRKDLRRLAAAIIGLLIGAVGVVFGIWRWQHQRLTSRVLREQTRFAALLEHANDPIFFLDDEGRILDLNRRAEELYGYDRQALIGRRGEILRSESDRHRAGQHLAAALAEGEIVVEAEHQSAVGETIPVEISTRLVELDQRVVLISIARDLRERKAAEQELRKTEDRYRTLVENLPDLIARFDRDLRCRFVSSRGDDHPLFRVDDPTGRSIRSLDLPGELVPSLEEAIRAAFATGEAQESELRLGDDGRSFNCRVVPEWTPDGEVGSALVIFRETTERRELEHQLRQSQKMEAVGRLAGGVAHDFNNILTSIQGHAALALDALDADHPLAAEIREISVSAQRAASLTRQLLAFSRRQVFNPRKVRLGEVVRGMETMLRRLIGETIRLEVDVEEGVRDTVLADPSQMEQVILNLAVNARDAMPDGGELRITVGADEWPGGTPKVQDADGGAVRLDVSDIGVGMAPETVDRIFEPFFTTKEAGRGTGLGLSTVYGIVEQTGGVIDVQSEPGQGTRVTLHFPTVEPSRSGEAEGATRERSASAGPATILLVEDEDAVRELARRVLEKDGHRVLAAATGTEALELLAGLRDELDLLLTDMVMPGLDGRRLATRVRDLHPDCAVIIMSGYTEDTVVREQKLGGGATFLEKPFTPDELSRHVAGHLVERD